METAKLYEDAMQRALELGLRGPAVGVNPRLVVILNSEGQIVAEGWHEGAGSDHAEVMAPEQPFWKLGWNNSAEKTTPRLYHSNHAITTVEPGPALKHPDAGIARVCSGG